MVEQTVVEALSNVTAGEIVEAFGGPTVVLAGVGYAYRRIKKHALAYIERLDKVFVEIERIDRRINRLMEHEGIATTSFGSVAEGESDG